MRVSRPVVLLVAIAMLVPAIAGCTTPDPANGTDDPTSDPPGDQDPGSDDGSSDDRFGFLAGLASAQPSTLMDLVERQVYENASSKDPRYRVPGTEGHAEAIPILEGMLEARGLDVTTNTFEAQVTELGSVNLTNIHGVREGTGSGEIWLTAHWDSRAWADASTGDDCEGVGEPVLGANDGAAGVAVVVHALDLLPETNATIHVVLFDGEDQGCGGGGWAIGSQHAADALSDAELDGITAFLLVDMPGDENLTIRREGWSEGESPELTELVFTVAERLDAHAFLNESGPPITDDHVAFLEKGVPAVDLIHLDKDPRRGPFPWTHHTVHDTPEHLSAENMAQVTEVVVGTTVAIDRGLYP